MSLTSSMKNLTQEIDYSTKNRIQNMAKSKSDVSNLLSNDCNARKTMSSNMKQSLNTFKNNLKNSTTNLLNTFKKEQSLVLADVLGAKAEWVALVQSQKKNR